MLVLHYNFLFKFFQLALAHLGELFVHIFPGDEHRFEVLRVRECLRACYLTHKVRLAVVCRVVDSTFKFRLRVLHSLDVGDLEVIDRGLGGLLGVFVPVLSLHNLIKSLLGLPLGLILNFFSHYYFGLVYHRERERQVVL